MAHVHSCGRIHPPGAVTCDQARQMIEKEAAEFLHELGHHGETCNCPHPREHVLKLRQERRDRREPSPRLYHASV